MPFDAEVVARLPEKRLIDLTNDDHTQTVIDNVRLNIAVQDAISAFQIKTGILADDTNMHHIQLICEGTQYFLEKYKGRDTAFLANQARNFFAGLNSLHSMRRGFLPGISTPNISPSVDRTKVLPDMDRKRQQFQSGLTNRYSDGEVSN